MARKKIPKELAAARVGACRIWPEASHVILSLVPVETPNLRSRAHGSIAVDQYWRLYYDPEWLPKQTPEQLIVAILHETAHCLARHHERTRRMVPPGNPTEHLRANMAADMAVWCLIARSNLAVPPDGVTHDQEGFPADLSYEQYFRLLKQRAEEQAQQDRDPEGDPEDDEDEQQSSDGGDSQEDDAGEESPDTPGGDDAGGQGDEPAADSGGDGADAGPDGGEETDAPGDGSAGDVGDGAGGADTGDAGSAAESGAESTGTGLGGGSCMDGVPREWELPPPEAGDSVSDQDVPPAIDQWQQEILVRHAAEKAEANGRGTCPGGWQELIEAFREPKLDPRRLLQKALTKRLGNLMAGSGRFTYRRPSRRPAQDGMLRPRSFQPVPKILVIVDTSGSMSPSDMALGVGLVSKCLNALRLQDGIRVIAGDVYARWDEQVFDPRKVQLVGRGGTNMAGIIETAAASKPHQRPELIVVVTDGETAWPQQNVKIPVVAAITRKTTWAEMYLPPSWIESVNLF